MTDNSMICAGIDVGKSHLDIAIHPGDATLRVAYDAAGLKALDAFLQEQDVKRVGFEASGGYEWRLLVHLRAGERPAARLQPAQLRFFARSRLRRAKNDRLDAALIAVFTAGLEEMPALPDARFDRLASELTYLEQIEQQIALVKTFAETALSEIVKHRHAREVARLETCRKAHLLWMEKTLRQDPDLAQRLDLLVSIKGVGLRSALCMLIRMPELGHTGRAEIAALAGVAPYDDDSGKHHGRRRIQGGRERLRKSLFMCAFTATQHNPDLATFYKRLRDNGKEHLCAVIAVARKLIILANAILIRKAEWTPEYCRE
ncbi:IS110 family transposase [Rhizobium sp. S152]|uniref:IS110 family transposase n=1 Tax=Rhizobium sp. S152 TaxID=3055038 RepID=UPI0025A987F6|nr:IS110 family transposase [Rhizobium sp. S152]MDM9629001.1 IS110 family transposase [Rhizobium sp. S152]